MFRTLEFTAWGLKTSTGVTGFRLISTQEIEDGGTQCDFSAVKNCTRATRHIWLRALWQVGGVVAWIPRVACFKTLQLVAALSCVQLGGVITSFKMYWKIALVSYLFYFSSLMVLKGEYKTVAVILILSWISKSDFSTFSLAKDAFKTCGLNKDIIKL